MNDDEHGDNVPYGPYGAAVLAAGNFSVMALPATAFPHALSVYWVSTNVPVVEVEFCANVAMAHPLLG